MWRQSCRLSYGSVMIPLCSVTLEWLIHSKQACWKGSATWIEHTVWVIQHVLIETSGNFSQFYVQCMWTRGSVVPLPPDPVASTDSGRGRGFVADIVVQTFDATFHLLALILKFWKENQTDKRKLKNTGGNVKKKIYIYSRFTWKGCKYILFYYCYKENVIKKDPIGWCCTSLWTRSGLDNIYTRVIQHIRHWLSNEEWVTVRGDGKIATQYEFLIVSCFERIKFIY